MVLRLMMDMDVQNTVKKLEEVLLFNPFEPKSHHKVTQILEEFDFHKYVYKKYTGKIKEDSEPPRCVFIPDVGVMRCMMLANVKFSWTDTLDEFLLRFGLLDNEELYLNESQ